MEEDKIAIQAKIPSTFLQLYADRTFSDVIIHTNDMTLHCHRFILAAFSDYFRAMFTNGMAESQQRQIELQHVDGKTMASIIHYFYGGILTINSDNVQNIAITASMFNVSEIVDYCCTYLADSLSYSNCVQILIFAEMYNFHQLAQITSSYILDNFEKCTSYDTFYEIPYPLLNRILPSERLAIKNELTVLNTLKKWIDTDSGVRKDRLVELLSHVRLAMIPVEQLIEFEEKETLLKECLPCFQMLLNAKNFHYLPERFFSSRTRVRQCCDGNWCAAIGGGGTRAISVKLDSYYNHDAGGAIQASRRSNYAAIAIGHKIYAIGGYGSSFTREPLTTTICFDCYKKCWTKSNLPDLPQAIAALCICQYDDRLYIAGGEIITETGGKTTTDHVAYLHCKSNHWQSASPMITKRSHCEMTVLNNVIYVVGGKDQSGLKLKTVEKYDPKSDQWTSVADTNESYQSSRLVAFKDDIYLYGYNERGNGCERYNPDTDIWEKIRYDLTFTGNSFDCWISGGCIRSINDDVRTFPLPPF